MEHLPSRSLFAESLSDARRQGPIVVADSLRTPANLGSILRLADNFGARRVLVVDARDRFKASKVRKTAREAYGQVDWQYCSWEEALELVPPDHAWVAIETSPRSRSLHEALLPRACALVVGNEEDGIPGAHLARCPEHFHVPMTGATSSMNVSHALAVALFAWQARWLGQG